MRGSDAEPSRPEDIPDAQQFFMSEQKEGGPSSRGAAFFVRIRYFGVNEVPQPQLFWTLGFRYFQPPSSRLAVL